MNKIKKILVISTMSSGKSTFINALIGKDILPSGNQACTGKIFQITNNSNNLNTVEFEGYNETIIREFENINLEDLNKDKYIKDIKINVFFPGISKKIAIYDTPGINNFLDDNHRKLTYKFLEDNDINNIIYLINATQIGVNDDYKFLIDLKNIYQNKKFNIIFLLNKIDLLDSEYENLKEVLLNTKLFLSNIGFSNPNLIPISSYKAKIFRKYVNNNLETRREIADLKNWITYTLEEDNINFSFELLDELINKTGIKELEKILNN